MILAYCVRIHWTWHFACCPQENATKAAGMVSSFCSQMGWADLEHLVAKFQGEDKIQGI